MLCYLFTFSCHVTWVSRRVIKPYDTYQPVFKQRSRSSRHSVPVPTCIRYLHDNTRHSSATCRLAARFPAAGSSPSVSFRFSGARHSDPRERKDRHQSAEAEGGGGADQEARGGGGQGGEGEEREGAEGEGQVETLTFCV